MVTTSEFVPDREQAARAFRRAARNGARTLESLPASLRRAILRYWGSVRRARKVLGLAPLPAQRQAWSRERVIREMRALHRTGQHMSSLAVIKAGRNDLVVAANRYAGGWMRACALAGIEVKRRQPGTGMSWDEATVVEEIRQRRDDGVTLAVSKVPKSLSSAAIRIFGSWRDAITAAGIDYGTVSLTRTYDDAELLRWLRRFARGNPTISISEFDQRAEHAVLCRRRWGSVEGAAAAAGLVGWPHRVRRRVLSRSAVIRALKQRHAAKLPMRAMAVRAGRDGHFLLNSVLRHFDSWAAALRAAGLRPA